MNGLVGQVLGGTYEITRPLGHGAMGVVYEAVHVRLRHKRVAIKLLQSTLGDSPVALARFRREAEVVTQIGHPHIVEVLDFNTTEDGTPYMAMEYLEGEDLQSRISRLGPLTPAEAAEVVRQTAGAVQAAHDHGIVHRDLKPANLFLVKDPERPICVKVLDFGLAKVLDARTAVTQVNVVMGTAHYMAPEQVRGEANEVDQRTDIFALGAILYHLVTGKVPFDASNFVALHYKICTEEPERLSLLVPTVPLRWDATISRAMAKRKEERHQRAKDFAAELCAALEQQCPERAGSAAATGAARPVPTIAAATDAAFGGVKGASQRRWIVLVIVGALVALAATFLALSWRPSRFRTTTATLEGQGPLVIPSTASAPARVDGAGALANEADAAIRSDTHPSPERRASRPASDGPRQLRKGGTQQRHPKAKRDTQPQLWEDSLPAPKSAPKKTRQAGELRE